MAFNGFGPLGLGKITGIDRYNCYDSNFIIVNDI